MRLRKTVACLGMLDKKMYSLFYLFTSPDLAPDLLSRMNFLFSPKTFLSANKQPKTGFET
jgi:hypothetical protein